MGRFGFYGARERRGGDRWPRDTRTERASRAIFGHRSWLLDVLLALVLIAAFLAALAIGIDRDARHQQALDRRYKATYVEFGRKADGGAGPARGGHDVRCTAAVEGPTAKGGGAGAR